MKKWILILALLLALYVFPAQAEPQSSLTFDYGHGVLEIDISGLQAESSYFLLISSSDGSVEEAIQSQNVAFMDLVTANAEGKLNVGLVSMNITPGSTVFLGGAFEDVISPYRAGTVEHNTALSLPEDLTRIEPEAFMNSGFTSLYLGQSVTFIGDRAFQNCASLRTIQIANDSAVFGADVFKGCTDLAVICSEGSTAAAYVSNLPNVTCRYQ